MNTSVSGDERFALELSRSVNSNPRRSATRYTRHETTPLGNYVEYGVSTKSEEPTYTGTRKRASDQNPIEARPSQRIKLTFKKSTATSLTTGSHGDKVQADEAALTPPESPTDPRIKMRDPLMILSGKGYLQNENGAWSTQSASDGSDTSLEAMKTHVVILKPTKTSSNTRNGVDDLDADFANPEPPQLHSPAMHKAVKNDSSVKLPDSKKVRKKTSSGKYHVPNQEDKPNPIGSPPVWSNFRQALCETLPYYRAYMSGAYTDNGIVRAFMIDKEVGERDRFTEEVVIARVGGGRNMDEASGRMIQKQDQDKSTFALGFQRAKFFKRPVVIIAGQGNKLCPTKIPHYYCVLGHFHVTDVWEERATNGYSCYMVRLEKVDLGEISWWAPKGAAPIDSSRDLDAYKTSSQQCKACSKESKEVYDKGWACLYRICDNFFDFGQPIDLSQLTYNDNFMNERTRFPGIFTKEDQLVPYLPTDQAPTTIVDVQYGIEKDFKKGIVCIKCKSCVRRIHWNRWSCETEGCGFEYGIRQRTVDIRAIRQMAAISQSPVPGITGAYSEAGVARGSGIQFVQSVNGNYDMFEYIIPGEEGCAGVIRHFKPINSINNLPDGPDDLFKQMQERDFGLKRNPVRQKGSTGEVLTSHWAANFGAPYKYGVTVLSRGFDEAAPVLIKALKRLTWAGGHAALPVGEKFQPFNELLVIGYFEETAIGYHDDGEKELGPTVATLSLGCQASMMLRPKAKTKLGNGSKNQKGTKAHVMRITLDHGDLVVMHGAGMQKLYEHAVTPHGKLRFALTCRYVRPELISDPKERALAIVKGTLPLGHEVYDYNG